MNNKDILNFKLYIFDLDGTIIDSEKAHYLSYNKYLETKITFDEYCKIFHSKDKKKFLLDQKINKLFKNDYFISIYKPIYISGFTLFLDELLKMDKHIIILTNSSKERCNYIKKCHPELNKIKEWYTPEDFNIEKPSCYGYINIINKYNYNIEDIIIFEDSYTGYLSIMNIDINKVFICDKNYYYYNDITSVNKFENYNNFKNFKLTNLTTIDKKINIYKNNIYNNFNSIKKIITCLKSLLIEQSDKNIYISGVGKSGLISKKIASTWCSVGLKITYLCPLNLWHGEMALLKDNDIIIFTSNSGNTEELLRISKFLKENYKVTTILISNNKINKISEYCTFNFIIEEKIIEIDKLNKAPTTSSLINLILLDILGIEISENKFLDLELFCKYHPGGDLGKYKPIDNVVISACGKGTRLFPITQHIPKILVNINNKNMLQHLIEYWSDYSKNIIILIEPQYSEIINFYTNNYTNVKLKFIENNNKENTFTLKNALNNEYNNSRILITWCDILINENINSNIFNKNIIFTNGNESRYYASNNNMIKKNNGNVFGCFYIHNFNGIDGNDNDDLCDIFTKNFGNFDTYEINNLIDIGDMPKLINYLNLNKTNYNTRYFNKIIEINGKLMKKNIHDFGISLIQNELNYYKFINNCKLNFPKIYEIGDNYFIMEKIKGTNINLNNLNINILKMIFKELNILHNTSFKKIDKILFYDDFKIEFYDKIFKRLEEINVIISWLNIKKVNNIKLIFTIDNIINNLYKKIINFFKSTNNENYNLIHGDCQFSNMLLNSNENSIHFIDPRGYFGNSKIFGSKYYDFSKLLYALSGYDQFNNDNLYSFELKDDFNLITNIDDSNILKYKNLFTENKIEFKICFYMVIIHWLGLSNYNKNNIIKCIASYYQGLYLYHKYIDYFNN